MAEKSSLIRNQIEETKGEIGDNLDSLQSQIRHVVEGAVEGVKEGLQKITPSHQIQKYPLLTVGGSLVAGAALGGWMASRSPGSSYEGMGPVLTQSEAKPEVRPGRFDEELALVKGVALGALTRGLGKMVKQAFPFLSREVDEVAGRIASKVEGTKIHKPEMGDGEPKEWAPAATETPTPDGEPKSYH